MYKRTFTGTGDGFAVENLDDVYPIANIECMNDTYDWIKKSKIALHVKHD